ncbi:MAG: hypothetical protein ACAI38_00815 [Myxococcota bacterium]|nr:hypothetical protein [Myxococcota bacterium]
MTANEAFDAGVTALGREDHPTAIASLLAARAAAPRDTEIAAALEAARTASGSHVHVDAPLPVGTTDFALLLVLVNIALCIAIGRRVQKSLLIISLAVWLVALGAWVAWHVAQPTYVVVTGADTKTYAANDTDSLERYRLSRGDELVLLESRDGWLKVEGPEGPAYVAAKEVVQTTHLASPSRR